MIKDPTENIEHEVNNPAAALDPRRNTTAKGSRSFKHYPSNCLSGKLGLLVTTVESQVLSCYMIDSSELPSPKLCDA